MSKFRGQSMAFAARAALFALPAQARSMTYYARLTGAAEDPPAFFSATGTAAVVIDDHNFTMRLHSAAFPSGETRSFFVVPKPGSLALATAALGRAGAAARTL